MQHRQLLPLTAGAAALGTLIALGVGAAHPGVAQRTAVTPSTRYEVTITNLTAAQVFSPALVTTHAHGVSLFTPGQPASAELAALAEDGDNVPLAMLLGGTVGVADVVSGMGPIPPGASESIGITTGPQERFLSVAGMLVTTNDALYAVQGLELPVNRSTTTRAVAYDAGTEFNSELCAFIPGPPCGSGGSHDPQPAEGFVHVHRGIHGIGDLMSNEHDWRNPVAQITVRRLP